MLSSLIIKNYRNLKELKINSLGKVNLITGKNNTGKSTILEAIALYAAKGDLGLIQQLLIDRGEIIVPGARTDTTQTNIQSISCLFTNRQIGFYEEDGIIIGSIENDLFGGQKSSSKALSIRIIKYVDEVLIDKDGTDLGTKRNVLKNDSPLENYKIAIKITKDSTSTLIPSEQVSFFRFRNNRIKDSCQFIGTRNIDKETNGNLFDTIALTEKEKFVVDALKIIEPATERIAFIGENSRERTAVIKLENIANPLPIRSMGDGINRILTIILALVNAENGYLLIDEFENGLHHTVQEKLWNIIFKLADSLNTQVFVTTHSEDCIAGFENILNNPQNQLDGKLIRLDNIDGKIQQVEFDAHDLRIATKNNIEIR